MIEQVDRTASAGPAIAEVLRIDDLPIVGLDSYEAEPILCLCLLRVSFGAI